MSEGQKKRGKGAGTGRGRRTLTETEKRRRAADRRARRAEQAEMARREELGAAELIAEDDAAKQKGAARTVVNAELYRTIYREWAEGMSYEDLSDRHGLSRRRIAEVVEDLKGSGLRTLGVGDPLFSVKMAEQLVLQRSAAVSQYTRLAAEVTEASMASVKLGYLKQRDVALSAFVDLISDLGWLPRHLGSISGMMDALQMAEVLLDVMEERGVDQVTQEAVVTAIELRVVKRQGRLAVAGVGPDLMGTATDVVSEQDEGEVHDEAGPGGEPDALGGGDAAGARGGDDGASGGDGGPGGDGDGEREAAGDRAAA